MASGPIGSLKFLSSISIPLFASVFRHAETLASAMDARCYHGEVGRTRLHPLRFCAHDLAAGVFMLALILCAVAVIILL